MVIPDKKYLRAKAIVVGNDKYDQVKNLTNAVNDAEAFAEALERLKFCVFYYHDIKATEWDDYFYDFRKDLNAYDVCIFYFAGHGVEIDGKNYLICKETPFSSDGDGSGTKRFSIDLQQTINDLTETKCPTSIIIIDACRDNPFAETRSPYATAKLAPLFAPKGTLIAFSTSPGEKASDAGMGNHSIYTGALLKHISELGLPIESFFKKVRTTVYNLSGEKQTSWEHTSLIGNFCFNSGQLIQNINVGNYADKVIRRVDYDFADEQIANIIRGFLSTQFADQRKALSKLKILNPRYLNKDELFMLGRCSLWAACFGCYDCQNFFSHSDNLVDFTINRENHFLNGALHELYFDEKGTLKDTVNAAMHEELIKYCHDTSLQCSFDYINKVLLPVSNMIYFIPSSNPEMVSVDVTLEAGTHTTFFDKEEECYYIRSIRHDIDDLSRLFQRHEEFRDTEELKEKLAPMINTPKNYLRINCNIEMPKRTLVLKSYRNV